MWLMGPYAQLTQYIAPFSQRRNGEEAPRPAVPLLREIDVRMVFDGSIVEIFIGGSIAETLRRKPGPTGTEVVELHASRPTTVSLACWPLHASIKR